MTLHQATAVAVDGRAILIEGPPGSGKSSLALALIDRGATLIGDDGVRLEIRAGTLWASPPDATLGLLELRGVGLIELPATAAPVALLLEANDAPPRFVEQAALRDWQGTSVPVLPFDLRASTAAVRAEYALAMHGLTHPVTSGPGTLP